ncbi:hypothetical protein ILUMI_22276 [Ignelater luminosus]|uniref:PiggyBac transposable element-derived protein domain-containing protein n=1 Tax=Ignelater luminosus TaxID=2038154 RepID=A0A8K0G2R7_IGNLU|nr:hypothetical protein ILUMI_22276 [Ignelater luminosus]
MTNKYLTDKKLKEILANLSESKDDFDIEKGDDEESERSRKEKFYIKPTRNRVEDEDQQSAKKEDLENQIMRNLKKEAKELKGKVYFDNFYMSIPLAVYLTKCEIHRLGTVRRPRIPNCKPLSDKEMAIEKCGTSQKFAADIDGVEISSVIWKDNKTVTLLSSFAGELPFSQVKRFDKIAMKTIAHE